MPKYAHSKKGRPESEWQTIYEHGKNVSDKAGEFAKPLGMEESGKMAGFLHDIGKYSNEFLDELRGILEEKVDHSTAGAQLVKSECDNGYLDDFTSDVLEYVIAGHHSGLPDMVGNKLSCLENRLKKAIPDYSSYETDKDFQDFLADVDVDKIESELKMGNCSLLAGEFKSKYALSMFLRVHMLYSCLIDADSLDTEHFYNQNKSFSRESVPKIDVVFHKFQEKINELQEKGRLSTKSIDKIRNGILNNCLDKSNYKSGFFSLTVPCGGGKTYSSAAFAINHAFLNKMDRVIYVAPYTSIIEQNAEVYRECLPENSVIEHHVNFEYPDVAEKDMDEYFKINLLASENWDASFVVTTTVQLFESMFSNKRSRCRKFHNMANSVIVLDEMQMIPTQYLKPCMLALEILVKEYNCTVVFCTATQLPVDSILSGTSIVELIDNPSGLKKEMKRVEIQDIGTKNNAQIVSLMRSEQQALCVANTKRHAKDLYMAMLKKCPDKSVFYLTTNLCAKHRSHLIKIIKQNLKDKLPCYVISTNLIEAGVDVDFPLVLREMTGVDSIAQSAGRANREGAMPHLGRVLCFSPEDEAYVPKIGTTGMSASISNDIFRRFHDVLELDAIREYFQRFHHENSLDKKKIIPQIHSAFYERTVRRGRACYRAAFQFASISDDFQFIEDNKFPIIINYNGELSGKINEIDTNVNTTPIYQLARKFQPFSVGVTKKELDWLVATGKVRLLCDTFYLVVGNVYSKDVGIDISAV